MRHSLLIAILILNSCAGHYPAPPPMTRCMPLSGDFYCIDPDGRRLPPVPIGQVHGYECFPGDDWEARKDWERSVSQ